LQSYAYNNRSLQTGISYTVPAGVAATPNVTFDYDSVGNRTQMIDGQGQTSYVYDTMYRMTSETRYFNGLSSSRQLSFTYNLVGQHILQSRMGLEIFTMTLPHE
jgi:YD repeat-containing protein